MSKIFSSEDKYITKESRSKEYKRRKNDSKTSIHDGQRKLLLSEIQFLSIFWKPKEVPHPVVVYAGAASGDHIPFLSKMFPSVQFHLYDPNPFKIKETGKIHIYNQLFTDEDAKKWSDKDNVFLISDIRSRKATSDKMSSDQERTSGNKDQEQVSGNKDQDDDDFPSEEDVIFDMNLQQGWVTTIKPVESLLKFRLPYPNKEIYKKMEYLQGYIFIQVWPPQTSTEARLVPLRNSNKEYTKIEWDTQDYEQKLFYHNSVTRETVKYMNPFTGTSVSIDPPELLNDYDSRAEVQILIEYVVKFSGAEKATKDFITKLSRAITTGLNSLKKAPKTMEFRRNLLKKMTNEVNTTNVTKVAKVAKVTNTSSMNNTTNMTDKTRKKL